MDVLLSWLVERSACRIGAEEAARLLTRQGAEVGRIRPVSRGLAGVVVAEVQSAQLLTERLTLVRVTAGAREGRVVTGAPVAEGDVVPWAPPGATLPDGRTLGVQNFHGAESEGMLLSSREAGFGPEEDPLLDVRGLPPGADLAQALDLPDWILEVDLTPNLAAFAESVDGLGRELRAALGLPFPGAADALGDESEGETIPVRLMQQGLVRQYLGAVIVKPPTRTPLWMRRRLWSAGQRSRGAVVDVTNYLLLERGQPLHAFDLDRVRPPIEVRRARPGERLITLDHVERVLDGEDIVIADARGPIGLAGVMGGEESEVTPETGRVFIEAAVFDPVSVRRTARRHAIPSLAAQRFEKGVDEEATLQTLREAIRLLLSMGAGEGRLTVTEIPLPPERRRIVVRPKRVRSLLGTGIRDEQMASDLDRLGLGAELGEGNLVVEIPSRRRDIEGEADVAEEVGRLEGYDTIPETTFPPAAPGRRIPVDVFEDELRSVVAGMGLLEHWGSSFASREAASRLNMATVAVENPLVREAAVLRPSLLPSLIGALEVNIVRRQLDVRLFEIGKVFRPSEDGVDEEGRLGLLLTGSWPVNWASVERPIRFFDLLGVIQAMASRLHVRADALPTDVEIPYLHPGRQARLVGATGEIGILGELHPSLAPEGAGPIACAELSLAALMRSRDPVSYRPLSRFPAVTRDLAFVFPVAVGYDEVVAAIRNGAPAILRSVDLFDVYEGPQIPRGSRSLAVRLVFQAEDRTLSDEEVDRDMVDIQERLRGCGGDVRGSGPSGDRDTGGK